MCDYCNYKKTDNDAVKTNFDGLERQTEEPGSARYIDTEISRSAERSRLPVWRATHTGVDSVRCSSPATSTSVVAPVPPHRSVSATPPRRPAPPSRA